RPYTEEEKASIRSLEKWNIPSDSPVVLYVGTMGKWHNLSLLIGAFEDVLKKRDATLMMVGSGRRLEEAKEAAKHLGKKVVFTGRVSHGDIPGYINMASVCIAPQSPDYICDSPLKIREYLACGRPVVAGGVAGLEELPKRTRGAVVLFEPEDRTSFARAMLKVLSDQGGYDKRGVDGRNYILEGHTWKHTAEKVIHAIEAAGRMG
ncbi:MAG: glycosyltransferase, partial [Thermoplasmata archaeon]|nr:glycosyltransferase [Thermoplasmata archaeon]